MHRNFNCGAGDDVNLDHSLSGKAVNQRHCNVFLTPAIHRILRLGPTSHVHRAQLHLTTFVVLMIARLIASDVYLQVDVRDASDVQTAYAFSLITGVHLSIKNSGHDYKGRSIGRDTLSLWVSLSRVVEIGMVLIQILLSDAQPSICATSPWRNGKELTL